MIDISTLPRPVTPGPWWVKDGQRDGLVWGADGDSVCEAHGSAAHLASPVDDARAIAALPDWIAACNELRAEVERMREVLGEQRHIVDIEATDFS